MPDQRAISLEVTSVDGTSRSVRLDRVAVEEPLEIRLGIQGPGVRTYRSISVTMRTPGDDAELAAGFLFTEGIVSSPDQIASIESWGPLSTQGVSRNIVKVELGEAVEVNLARLERHFYTSSSCGVCGKASLEAVRTSAALTRHSSSTHIVQEVLHKLPQKLRQGQQEFDVTGGLHGCALFTPEGGLIAVREDVGRHNALDKLIGSQWLAGLPLTGVLMLSGRASFELVQKAAVAGIPIVAAVGAPSSLAVELAEEFGLTLAGFVRDGRFNIYCGAERIAAS
jgi:FdhD protein